MNSPKWFENARIYHIYPLGFTGAPEINDFQSHPESRIDRVREILDHIRSMGLNTIYFGPVFESVSHGYDTADYTCIDRRLGTNASFRQLVDDLHKQGVRVVLDGVFNHVGREFQPFRDLRERGKDSPFIDWFEEVNFEEDNVFHDGFSYKGWEGHLELVSLNLKNPEVKSYLLDCVRMMMEDLQIDGLRLDVAYLLNRDFIAELARFCRSLKEDFWLMGEIIHGDYNEIAGPDLLDSATNYECYKGLYSSHNDYNLHEIAWSLNRQFGDQGIYRDLKLYNFLDNHDVDRIASVLENPGQLPALYALLFMMPGIPSVYYGSEWLYRGKRTGYDDKALRPSIDDIPKEDRSLVDQIRLFSHIREEHKSLSLGKFTPLETESEQMMFARQHKEETLVFAMNICGSRVLIPQNHFDCLENLFDPREMIPRQGQFELYPYGWKIFKYPCS